MNNRLLAAGGFIGLLASAAPAWSQPCNLADITEVGGTAELPGIPDTQLTVDDVIVFVQVFADATGCPGSSPFSPADVTGIGGPPEAPDGQLTVDDALAFLNAYSAGCPSVVVGRGIAAEMVYRELGSTVAPLSVIIQLNPDRSSVTLRVLRQDALEEETTRRLPARVVSGPIWLTESMPWVEPGSTGREGLVGITAVGTGGIYHLLARVFDYRDGQGGEAELITPVSGYLGASELGPIPASIAADASRRAEFAPSDACIPPVPNTDGSCVVQGQIPACGCATSPRSVPPSGDKRVEFSP